MSVPVLHPDLAHQVVRGFISSGRPGVTAKDGSLMGTVLSELR
jgi:hypothetical protein